MFKLSVALEGVRTDPLSAGAQNRVAGGVLFWEATRGQWVNSRREERVTDQTAGV